MLIHQLPSCPLLFVNTQEPNKDKYHQQKPKIIYSLSFLMLVIKESLIGSVATAQLSPDDDDTNPIEAEVAVVVEEARETEVGGFDDTRLLLWLLLPLLETLLEFEFVLDASKLRSLLMAGRGGGSSVVVGTRNGDEETVYVVVEFPVCERDKDAYEGNVSFPIPPLSNVTSVDETASNRFRLRLRFVTEPIQAVKAGCCSVGVSRTSCNSCKL